MTDRDEHSASLLSRRDLLTFVSLAAGGVASARCSAASLECGGMWVQ